MKTHNHGIRYSIFTVMILMAMTSTASAQLASLGVGYAFPPGGKAGSTVEVKLGGADWTSDTQFYVHDQRVKLEVLSPPSEVIMHEPPYWFDIKSHANDPPLTREVSARFTLPANLPAGPIRWRVSNANGAGNGGLFMVGVGPEITEDERRTAPQELTTLPITVNGRIRRIEEVDRYRFRATRTGPITLDLMARRLGSEFHGVLEVRDETGKLLAEVIDTEGMDPTLIFAAEQGKNYIISVHDVDHRGYRMFTYRLSITPGPQVLGTIPAVGKRGEKRSVEFIGIGIATGQIRLESVTKEVTFPADPLQNSFTYHLETPFGNSPDFPMFVSDIPELIESPTRTLTVPSAITGRLLARSEMDEYTITGKAGTTLRIALESRRFGSPLDVTLTLFGPDNKPLATSDDTPTGIDAELIQKLPVDGVYRIVVSDISGKPRNLTSIYHLSVTIPTPDFTLSLPPLVNVPLGGKFDLNITAVRHAEFKEPIAITITGLPAGVTIPPNLVIAPTVTALTVPLTCAKDAAVTTSMVRITGTAKVGPAMVTRTAFSPIKGNLAARDVDSNLVPDALVAITMKPPFKVKPVAADGGRRVPRGATYLADLIVERTDGFAGEIILDMAGTQSRHRQGNRGPIFPVAAGLKAVAYPVFLPEWMEATRTSRIALVAMAKIPDPKGTPRIVMAAMDGQIVMSVEGALLKLSLTPEELTVRLGEPFSVPLRLAKAGILTDSVGVELIVPVEIAGLVSMPPLPWPAAKETAIVSIASKNDPKLIGIRKLTLRATTKKDGYPVVAESEFEVEFVPTVPMGAAK